ERPVEGAADLRPGEFLDRPGVIRDDGDQLVTGTAVAVRVARDDIHDSYALRHTRPPATPESVYRRCAPGYCGPATATRYAPSCAVWPPVPAFRLPSAGRYTPPPGCWGSSSAPAPAPCAGSRCCPAPGWAEPAWRPAAPSRCPITGALRPSPTITTSRC